ncbi:pseudoazurin [uncultured Bdellovibrio sp.]|uniref:pseudoazurin n=1 Tax=Bdellovibrio sp. HCB-162 TaxID=3394234 RepID=UPI0025D2CDA5|nr:pseudoazurin [uncultured Bdellovibrio sp.]
MTEFRKVVLAAILFSGVWAQAAVHEVKMLNNGKDGIMVFEPGYLKINKGDSVKFIPTDAGHDVSSVETPQGIKPWSSPSGKAFTVQMKEEGLYLFECKAHLPMAMVGVIQVGSAKNLDKVKTKAQEMSKQFAMNKDRLDKYLAQAK